jgi:hypothetical protein
MGLLDAPTPAFGWLDAQMGLVMSPGSRLVLWGVLGGAVSMLLYRLISPQARVARGKAELAEARRSLDAYEGELPGARRLIGRLLTVALAQVGRVGWPALVASLPALCLIVWADTVYGHQYPARGEVPRIETSPGALRTQWVEPGPEAPVPRIVVADRSQRVLAEVPLARPVPIVHKRHWWNVFIGNPAGYPARDGTVDRVAVSLPRREYLPIGPEWLRGWETAFFVPLLAASITLKALARIE